MIFFCSSLPCLLACARKCAFFTQTTALAWKPQNESCYCGTLAAGQNTGVEEDLWIRTSSMPGVLVTAFNTQTTLPTSTNPTTTSTSTTSTTSTTTTEKTPIPIESESQSSAEEVPSSISSWSWQEQPSPFLFNKEVKKEMNNDK